MSNGVNDFEPSSNTSSGRFGSDRGVGDNDQRILSEDYSLGNGVAMRREIDHGFSRQHDDLNDRIRGTMGTHRENFSGIGPKGWRRSDERIYEEVCEELYHNPYVNASDIEVKVEKGCVYLLGSVGSRRMKREAELCAERAGGVEDVRNELRIM